VTFLGVKPSSVGFTTCGIVTILIVPCRLPLLILLWFIQGTDVQCILILSCVLGFETVLEEGSIVVTELNCPAVFMVKHLNYIPNAVGSDFISSALKHHFVLPVSVWQ
jgi:hypothetical protein